jgi:hypothetical protein
MLETLLITAVLMAPPEMDTASMPVVSATRSDPNQTGRKPSAYEGIYYRKTFEPYRQCVAQREGRHQYWVTGNNGRYQSTYQMTPALVRGAAWMMTAELKSTYGKSKGLRIRNTLLETPGKRWARQWMDQAFWTVLNWRGDASGAQHWAGGRFSCYPGMANYGGDR